MISSSDKFVVDSKDIDGNDHMNHVKQVDRFGDSRQALLDANGLGFGDVTARGFRLTVVDQHYTHSAQAFRGDIVEVYSSFTYEGRVRIESYQEMVNHEGKVVAKADVVYAFVSDETGKPVRPPADFAEMLKV